MAGDGDSIWEVLREASETLPEPFSAQDLLAYVSRRRPDVAEASIRTHLNYALVESKRTGPWAARTPFLTRVERGRYRRLMPGPTASAGQHEPAPTIGPRSAAGRVVLVGCSDSKAPTARAARELFTGPGFVKARDRAEAAGLAWYVLSSKFGLIDPDELVAPYDVYLPGQSARYQRAWGQWVVAQLSERHELRGLTVEAHASRGYCAPLVEPLAAAGAELEQPLAGLRQGERLAWYGQAAALVQQVEERAVDVSPLLDKGNAVTPAELLAAGRSATDRPGLYTWWVDDEGAEQLTAGLGERLAPGLIYAGRAGGVRPNGAVSSNTLWGRLATMHLGGNRNFSTFRLTLTAGLTPLGMSPLDESDLTAWMHRHLRVAVLPMPAADVLPAEQLLLQRTDPPLNLRDVPATPLRRTISRRRSEVTRWADEE